MTTESVSVLKVLDDGEHAVIRRTDGSTLAAGLRE